MPRILEMPERGTQKEEVEVSHIQHPDVPYKNKEKDKKSFVISLF